MSGIFGIIHLDGRPVDAADLERMRDAMAHRGPVGSCIWVDGGAGLGQLMLHSTPESLHETLPWKDPESGLVITADARIDNREELAAALGGAQAQLSASLRRPGTTDSQFILQAYRRWGEDCTKRLLGSFAFAIWNPLERTLFCARDQMGAAPFCFTLRDRLFAFASEPEALLGVPGVARAPNEEQIATILVPAFENRADERTWLRDVDALMPAHSLQVGVGRAVRKRRYWALMPGRQTRYASRQECLAHFEHVFGEAVRCRLRAPDKVATMLSGGLDSAGIAAMAGRLVGKDGGARLQAYSAIDDDREASAETRAILSMARMPGVNPHFVAVPSFEGMIDIGDVADAAWDHAHPVDNMLLLPAMMCLASKRDGNRVMLEGASGDVTLKSSTRYASPLLRRGRFLRAWRECSAASRNHVYLRGTPPARLYLQNLWRAFAPAGLRRRRLRSQRTDFGAIIDSGLMSREFAVRLQLVERLEQQQSEDEAASLAEPGRSPADRSLAYIQWALSGYGRVAARYGVEVRDPWADLRVLSFCAGLPGDHLVRDGWTKHLVRDAFADELDPQVLWRRDKEHLGWRFTQAVMAQSRDLIGSLMLEDLAALERYVDLDVARDMYERWRARDEGAARDRLYELVTMILWLQRLKSL